MNAIAQASAAPVRGPKLDNRRVLAGIVDLAIVALGGAVVLFAGDALSGDTSELRGTLSAVMVGWALYYYFALESGEGQTVGKKLMKLRVVRVDGSPVGMREVAVRTILRVVDGAGAYIVGLIVMLVTGEKRQRLGDLAAGTIVVDASSASAMPAVETPVAETDQAEAGEASDAPQAAVDANQPDPTRTITLPSRPEPPATLAHLSAPEAPAAPEMRPFPPVEEPVAEEPVVEKPVAEKPHPEIASPSIQELADDVAAAQAEPAAEVVEAEPVVEEPVVEAELIDEEPAVEAEPIVDEPVDAEPVVEDEPVDEEPVTVKSVETVSAIDLIMDGSDEAQGEGDDAEEPASA